MDASAGGGAVRGSLVAIAAGDRLAAVERTAAGRLMLVAGENRLDATDGAVTAAVGGRRVVAGPAPADAVVVEAVTDGGEWVPVRTARGAWVAVAPLGSPVRIVLRSITGNAIARFDVQTDRGACLEARPRLMRPQGRRQAVRSRRRPR